MASAKKPPKRVAFFSRPLRVAGDDHPVGARQRLEEGGAGGGAVDHHQRAAHRLEPGGQLLGAEVGAAQVELGGPAVEGAVADQHQPQRARRRSPSRAQRLLQPRAIRRAPRAVRARPRSRARPPARRLLPALGCAGEAAAVFRVPSAPTTSITPVRASAGPRRPRPTDRRGDQAPALASRQPPRAAQGPLGGEAGERQQQHDPGVPQRPGARCRSPAPVARAGRARRPPGCPAATTSPPVRRARSRAARGWGGSSGAPRPARSMASRSRPRPPRCRRGR